MTYQNDPNINRPRDPLNKDRSYTGWIVGGVVALAVILGIFAMSSRTDNTNTASNADRPAATAPSTTGSGTATPVPGPGKPAAPVPAR